MKYTIFHPTGGQLNHQGLNTDTDFEQIGVIQANSLEDAWVKSQNDYNPSYEALGARSTSVGDIIKDEEGVAHMVLGLGFRIIPTIQVS